MKNNKVENNLFEIKKGIEVPKITKAGKKGKLRLSLETMEVNDMIEVPNKPKNIYPLQKSLGMKFTTRELDNGAFGIWRKQ